MAQRALMNVFDRVKNNEKVSKFLVDLEDRVPPYVFNGLAGGLAGGLLSPLPAMALMLFKFKTWEDYFIGYVLFSLASSGNAVFSEKGTPKELLILTGVLVHFAVSIFYATMMSLWTERTSDPAMIISRSMILSVAMHYVNLVFVPKAWNMPLFNDFLNFTGYYPHMLCHLAFGATVGSVIVWMKTMREGRRGTRRRTEERVAQSETIKEKSGAPSTTSTGTTGESASDSVGAAAGRVKDTVSNVLGNIQEKLTSAAETVVGTVQQQTSATPQKGDATTAAAKAPSETSATATQQQQQQQPGMKTGAAAAGETAPSYKDVAKSEPSIAAQPTAGTAATPIQGGSAATTATQQRLHQAQPYLDAAAAGKQLHPDIAGTKKYEAENPVPSVAEKKRL